MAHDLDLSVVNANPSRFDELAGVLASAYAYLKEYGDLTILFDDFHHLYNRALSQPPCYSEVNELTGQSLSSGDRTAGKAAWMLQNLESLQIYGVHSLLWHEVNAVHSAPLIEQMGRAMDLKSRLSPDDLRHICGDKKALTDVVGVKDGKDIWIVQTLSRSKTLDSAISRTRGGLKFLFKSRVFQDPVLDGQSLQTLIKARYIMRRAFPGVPVFTFCLVMHPMTPDFESYQLTLPDDGVERIVLTDSMIRTNSIDQADKLKEDFWALLSLPHKLDNDLFQGLPPCRGGRTLGILASTAKRQLEAERLLVWKERDVIKIMESDFNYSIPRDKVRHDLVDRLVGNGFMRKYGPQYSLTMKGIARYLYCLAKFITKAARDPMDVLNECGKQRDRILEHYHYL